MDAREQRQARRETVAKLTAEREAQGRNKAGRKRFRRFRRRVGTVLVEWLAPLILRLIARTWRIERTGEAGLKLLRSERPWVCTMWHGRMLTLMPVKHHCRRNIGVLVSPSDDGGLAKRALDKFRYQVVRGSLSKRGATAMREMHELLTADGQLVITPDGPRGPRHSINTGAAWLARATGVPIIPVSTAMSRAWRFKSWDRMCIPKPFARVLVHYGDPVTIDKHADDALLEVVSSELRTKMIAAERAAFGQLEVENDLGDDA
ncbi:MAG: lysophospholipid acyltransferase (LPLAT)-like uncharacterized protein [Hyphomicrobiaceae bacterium]